MGASAGGLEAFERFFDDLPPDSRAAFVLAQHLDPQRASLMPELLARHTRMPVVVAKDGESLQASHVYLNAPNASLTVAQGHLRVQSPLVRPPLVIDRLFQSLAEDQGANAVCILLSGSGTDGTLGLKAVREQGGLAMAQAPEQAKHDGMLRSAIATGLVDHVLPVEQMPAKIAEHASYHHKLRRHLVVDRIQEEAGAQLGRICEILRARTGHDFSGYKAATLVRRIQRRLNVYQLASVAQYVDRLRGDPGEVERLLQDLLIGVTHFFRDPEAFDVLAGHAIAPIVARAGADESIRVWTPGCATGEEAFSLAILLLEEMERCDVRRTVQIFAGDIDQAALAVARAGVYPDGIAAQVGRERLDRFFVRERQGFQIAKRVREMCVFSAHDLIRDPPFSRVDLVVCRNLLIYLEAELQRHVMTLFHYALRPGGFLFLGPSESAVGPANLFRAVDKRWKLFQRNETIARPRARLAGGTAGSRRVARAAPDRAAARTRDAQLIQRLERVLIDHHSPAWVVVSAKGETLYFSPRTGRFLEPSAGAPSVSLVDLARKGLRLDLRTALHQAVKTGASVRREGLEVTTDGGVVRVDLVVRPLDELPDSPGLFMVVFHERGAVKATPAPTAGERRDRRDQKVAQLERELHSAQE
ncbi:MAG TPA: chemotaxis protein CheB, partial [Myxococcota bacterium]|nr:chemotaxis protein CheB [Myxococcota bacterium]